MLCAVGEGTVGWRQDYDFLQSYWSPRSWHGSRYPKLALLTVVLRPPCETLGKAEKLGCWVKLRGVGIFFARKGLPLQQAFFMFGVFFPLCPSPQLEEYKPVSLFRGYVLDTRAAKPTYSWCLLLEEILSLLVLPLLTKAYVHLPQTLAGRFVHLLIELGLCFLPGPADLPSGPFQQRISNVLFDSCITFNMAHSSSFLSREKGHGE